MAFNSSLRSPALRFAANEIILGLRKQVTKVSLFATNFTTDAQQKGSTMLIPVVQDVDAGEFNRSSNNYGDVDGSIMYTPMTFNKHMKHSFGFTENDFNLVNGTAFWTKSTEASIRALSRGIANAFFGHINSTEIPTSGNDYTEWYDKDGNPVEQGTSGATTVKTGSGLSFSAANEYVVGTDPFTKLGVAKLREACEAAGIAPGDTILALTPAKFAEVLSLLEAQMYGGTEAIRDGLVPYLYGYKAVIEVNELPTEGGNQVGALIPATSMAAASRILPILNPKLYEEIGVTTDEKSGLAVQMRRGGDWTTGDSVATAECLFGTKLIQPTKIVRLVKAATSGSGSASDAEA